MSRKPTTSPPPRRNPLHDHPLLRKGGLHEKSRKAERREAKARLRREWCPRSVPGGVAQAPFIATTQGTL